MGCEGWLFVLDTGELFGFEIGDVIVVIVYELVEITEVDVIFCGTVDIIVGECRVMEIHVSKIVIMIIEGSGKGRQGACEVIGGGGKG